MSFPVSNNSQSSSSNRQDIPQSVPAPGSWDINYDGFTRISRQAPVASARLIEEIFSQEHLDLFDQQLFTELNYELTVKVKRNPDDIRTHIGLGLCTLANDDPEKAAEHFAHAIDINGSFLPSKYLGEVEEDDPEDWLMMAEALGHLGLLDQAKDICERISKIGKYSDKMRALASQTKQQIEQDFYLARERIITGNSPKSGKDSFSSLRLWSTIAFVIGPIILTLLLGSFSYSSFKINTGKNLLAAAIYRVERIKQGDQTVDLTEQTEEYFRKAYYSFEISAKFNPLSAESVYYQYQTALSLINLGKIRQTSPNPWDESLWDEARDMVKQSKHRLQKMKLKDSKMKMEKKAWQKFQQESIKNPITTIL